MDPLQLNAILLIFRVLMGIAAIGGIWYAVSSYNDLQRAPLEAQLDASRGNQAAAKKGVERQNAATQGRKAAADAKAVKGNQAVNKAGGIQLKRAETILTTPPVKGLSDCASAAQRIDTELGLR
jgi:hypothetical protein